MSVCPVGHRDGDKILFAGYFLPTIQNENEYLVFVCLFETNLGANCPLSLHILVPNCLSAKLSVSRGEKSHLCSLGHQLLKVQHIIGLRSLIL